MTTDTVQPRPDDLMHEKVVMERYGHLFSLRELREARRDGEIGWFNLRKGPHYTAAQIMEYLSQKEHAPCQATGSENQPSGNGELPAPIDSSRSEGFGSNGRRGRRTSPSAGMTPELEKLAASQLASKT